MLSRVQDYQTIDPFLDDTEKPYERVPQIYYSGRWFGRHLGFESSAELVNFDRNVGATGWRLDTTQELSIPSRGAAQFVTPAVALRQTNYWLDNVEPGHRPSLRASCRSRASIRACGSSAARAVMAR